MLNIEQMNTVLKIGALLTVSGALLKVFHFGGMIGNVFLFLGVVSIPIYIILKRSRMDFLKNSLNK
jgi:hypothetical protein